MYKFSFYSTENVVSLNTHQSIDFLWRESRHLLCTNRIKTRYCANLYIIHFEWCIQFLLLAQTVTTLL